MDGVLAVSLIIHSHLGFDQCITDYFHPRKAPFLGPLMVWMLRVATALSVYGVYEFNTNDIGEFAPTDYMTRRPLTTSSLARSYRVGPPDVEGIRGDDWERSLSGRVVWIGLLRARRDKCIRNRIMGREYAIIFPSKS